MKSVLPWCLLGLVFLVSAVLVQAQKASENEKAVEALEEQWTQGQKTNNPDLIVPLLSAKIVITDSDSKVLNHAEFLERMKKAKFTSAENSDVKVTVFGNTAIATGGAKYTGTDETGKPFDTTERWTDTWVKMPDGKWQCVASHSSPVKK